VFCLRQRDHSRAFVEHHEARTAGALINRANITFQENGSQAGIVAGAFQHTSRQMPTRKPLKRRLFMQENLHVLVACFDGRTLGVNSRSLCI
jgi:hypothetical protein